MLPENLVQPSSDSEVNTNNKAWVSPISKQQYKSTRLVFRSRYSPKYSKLATKCYEWPQLKRHVAKLFADGQRFEPTWSIWEHVLESKALIRSPANSIETLVKS